MFLKGWALYLQATPTLENAESVETVMVSQSPMDILISGGMIGIFIYVVLLILSIIAVYIFFESERVKFHDKKRF